MSKISKHVGKFFPHPVGVFCTSTFPSDRGGGSAATERWANLSIHWEGGGSRGGLRNLTRFPRKTITIGPQSGV